MAGKKKSSIARESKTKSLSRVHPDDLSQGRFVIVREILSEPQSFSASPIDDHLEYQRRRELQEIVGLPLQVIGMSLPFVAVQVLGRRNSSSYRSPFDSGANRHDVVSLDSRSVVFQHCDVCMAAAFISIPRHDNSANKQ